MGGLRGLDGGGDPAVLRREGARGLARAELAVLRREGGLLSRVCVETKFGTLWLDRREGVGGNFFAPMADAMASENVVLARLGTGGCGVSSFLTALVRAVAKRFDIDFCFKGWRGVTSSLGSSLGSSLDHFVTHHPPLDFFCSTLTRSFFRESIFPKRV